MKAEGQFRGGEEEVIKPLQNVRCSHYEANLFTDYRISTDLPVSKAVDVNVLPYTGCGDIFGPELMFAHGMDAWYKQSISIVKVTSPGTEIYKHWSKENGFIWPELVNYIQEIDTTKDKWNNIAWFQGESDTFVEDNAVECGRICWKPPDALYGILEAGHFQSGQQYV
jgi:hypothetical protein